jgi:hypothetical protein
MATPCPRFPALLFALADRVAQHNPWLALLLALREI